MLSANQPRKISLYGKDYVLWKDSAGNVKALPNACPHMSAMLSEGWCEKRPDGTSVIVCPFHALGFDGDGCTFLPDTQKKTLPQTEPLELLLQGDFIWSYGGFSPEVPLPDILEKIAANYQYVGHTADMSVPTDMLSMLLNMHDYNHQNGTHRPLFRVKEVRFKQFDDLGHHSHAFYDLPRAPVALSDIWQNPGVLAVPGVVNVHLENIFPFCVIFHADMSVAKIAQIHLFIPESDNQTRTFVLLYAIPQNPFFPLLKNKFLDFAKLITEQDADILGKIYPDYPQKMKLNNEVGMEWVRRNYSSWPKIVEPQLSRMT
jgi:phenylpropionate dioxygenase-like ring-hydroxylating dioxygenase large terminal subunit